MAVSISWSARLTLIAVFLFALLQVSVTAQYVQPYCSTSNTASTPRNESIYQSNSLCSEFCNGAKPELQPRKYALAVVQYQSCWCTDFAPASTTTGCDMTCPGWEFEQCGNTSPSLYGYIKLTLAISGTQGGSTPTSTSAVQEPETTTSSQRTTSTTSSSTSASSTWTPTPVTSLQTITGQVRTVTVTPTVPPNVQATNPITQDSKGGGGGLGTGGAVGLTIGLVALVALVGAAVFFFYRKRRRDQEGTDDLSRRGSSAGFGAAAVPSRTMSENSRYVLGTDGRRVVETWEPGETAEVRRSRLIPVDQRLDPFSPVYQRGDNKSRESVNTIRDDHDYSRRMVTGGNGILRATNPD